MALAKIKTKDFNGAILICKESILAENSGNDLSYFFKAVAFDSLKNYPLANTNYQEAISIMKAKPENKIKIQPKYASYYSNLGNVMLKLNEPSEALNYFNLAIQCSSNDYKLYLFRGKNFFFKNDFQNALIDLNKAISLNDTVSNLFLLRGLTYKKIGQYENAINDFTRTTVLKHNSNDSYTQRGICYQQIGKLNDAIKDFKLSLKLQNDSTVKSLLDKTTHQQFELQRENEKPTINVITPQLESGNKIKTPSNKEDIILRGSITDASLIEEIKVNGILAKYENEKKDPEFEAKINIQQAKMIEVTATDIYKNKEKLIIEIIKTESNPPNIKLTTPFASSENELFINGKDNTLYIEGIAKDESIINSIEVEGANANFELNTLNPSFTATINIIGKDTIHIQAKDIYGNTKRSTYKIIRDDPSGINPMGRTWVVIIQNSQYQNLQKLEGTNEDVTALNAALANYNVEKIIIKRNLPKAELDKFFSIELRDLIQKNQINSVLIWYAGHGKFINETGYWLPIDATKDDEFSYYNVNNLKASLQSYTKLKHILVISDACESGPSFYLAMRDEGKIRNQPRFSLHQTKNYHRTIPYFQKLLQQV